MVFSNSFFSFLRVFLKVFFSLEIKRGHISALDCSMIPLVSFRRLFVILGTFLIWMRPAKGFKTIVWRVLILVNFSSLPLGLISCFGVCSTQCRLNFSQIKPLVIFRQASKSIRLLGKVTTNQDDIVTQSSTIDQVGHQLRIGHIQKANLEPLAEFQPRYESLQRRAQKGQMQPQKSRFARKLYYKIWGRFAFASHFHEKQDIRTPS